MRLCERCKHVQKTCCQESPKVTLTLGDVARIRAATGREDFFELAHYPDLSFMAAFDYDPHWRAYTVLPGNLIRQLRMDDSGACTLLRPGGCSLKSETRPLLCRLYPYNYNEFGMIGLYAAEELWCPVRLLEEGENLTGVLGMSLEKANQTRLRLYEELRAELAARTQGR